MQSDSEPTRAKLYRSPRKAWISGIGGGGQGREEPVGSLQTITNLGRKKARHQPSFQRKLPR